MLIIKPCIITSRLLPGVAVGRGSISIKYGIFSHSRQYYYYYIDIGNYTYESNELSTGCYHTLQIALADLLCFLTAAAESYRCHGLAGENSDLFPEEVLKWAVENKNELETIQLELEERADVIKE